MSTPATPLHTQRNLRVRGTVQGVGYRPFIQRIAERLGLTGWVRNDTAGVLIHVTGCSDSIDTFVRCLTDEAPRAASIEAVEILPDTASGLPFKTFVILESDVGEELLETAVPADLAVCPECRAELLSPSNRRHHYPFINCTQCGPRYSIIESLPYDRPRTTMHAFKLCPACRSEYLDTRDRRFHAQPNACPVCGPHLELLADNGDSLAKQDDALQMAAAELLTGAIIAVKGIGGFHLMCDARNEVAVSELRRRKHRDEKPFAVLFPTLEALHAETHTSAPALHWLQSPQAPVVLVKRKESSALSAEIAPGNPWVGALLSYAPLHLLLLEAFGGPLVATSANLAEEPLCIDNQEALTRLAGIADRYLIHNRPIARPVDDSVLRLTTSGTPILLRRARGYAPSPLRLPGVLTSPLLCVGGQMKNAIAVAHGSRVVLSPHIGDLGNAVTQQAFARTVEMLGALQRTRFEGVAHDKHPAYSSTHFAHKTGLPCVPVQHHLAHILACLLEHGHPADNVLGVSWDGTGHGEDGTVWGGEFLLLQKSRAYRFARLRPFVLAGGEAAVRDARRVALGLVADSGDETLFTRLARDFGFKANDSSTLHAMIKQGLNTPVCSSAGRLFDAAGALLGLGLRNNFEGQLPLAVESAALRGLSTSGVMPFPLQKIDTGASFELDWRPALNALLRTDLNPATGAAAFHRGLADGIVSVATEAGVGTVALSGGCFQNALLLELTCTALEKAGFRVLVHRELAPNDGNLAAGQALGALLGITDVFVP